MTDHIFFSKQTAQTLNSTYHLTLPKYQEISFHLPFYADQPDQLQTACQRDLKDSGYRDNLLSSQLPLPKRQNHCHPSCFIYSLDSLLASG